MSTLKQKLSELAQAIAATDNHLHEITEKSANKVNSFDAATNPAVQYPTVKAVIDFIGGDNVDLATKEYVQGLINDLVGGAPGALDTLDELAAALGDDANFAATVTNQIAAKANKSVTVKGTGYLTGGGDLTSNRTIDINSNTKSKIDNANTHAGLKNNPHNVTKGQVGLGNVDNTSDIDKPVSTAQQEAIDRVQINLDEYKDVIGWPPFPNYRDIYINSLDFDFSEGGVGPSQPYGPSIAISSDWTTAEEACGRPLTGLKYYNGADTGIKIGDKVYNEPVFKESNHFSGAGRWYNTDNGKAVRISFEGIVDGIHLCDDGTGGGTGGGGTDPVPAVGNPIMVSVTSVGVHDTSAGGTNGCVLAATTTRYYKTPNGEAQFHIQLHDVIYTDPECTIPYNGGGLYRMTNQGKLLMVGPQGLVEEIIDCGDEYTPPQYRD